MARALVRLVLVLCAVAFGAAAGAAWWSPAGALPPPDTTYAAVVPCVVFDSRPTQGAIGGFVGPINGGQAVTEQITGAIPAAQGGNAPGGTCGIPVGASSVEINVVAVNALNEGNLRVTDGSPSTTGGAVNYNNLTPKLNTSNAVIVPLNASGQLVVTPNCGAGCTVDSVDIRGVVVGYFSNSLALRVAALEAKLQDVTRVPSGVGGHDTLRISGMNLQIVDGSGTTPCDDATPGGYDSACNGQGNLVVGYGENGPSYVRTGSHNIVGGMDNGWSSYGGAVLGFRNQVSNDAAAVTGGSFNEATQQLSSIAGGSANRANGVASSVTGGFGNQANAQVSSITGGTDNVANGDAGSVTGGTENTANSDLSTVSGGAGRTATGDTSWVAGTLFEAS